MISGITAGNMHPNLASENSDPQINFKSFCEANGIDSSKKVGLRIDPSSQVGASVATEPTSDVRFGSVACSDRLEANALVVPREIGVFVLSADCYPIVISGSEHHAIGHVSWRSVDSNLPGMLVQMMKSKGYAPQSLNIQLGPGIARSSNLLQSKQVTQMLGSNALFWNDFLDQDDNNTVAIDLKGAIIAQLVNEGLTAAAIYDDPRDTYTDPDLFSLRASLAGVDKIRGNHVFIAPGIYC